MHAFVGRHSVFLLLFLSSAAFVAAAGPSLEATGSGWYGLAKSPVRLVANSFASNSVDPTTGGKKSR